MPEHYKKVIRAKVDGTIQLQHKETSMEDVELYLEQVKQHFIDYTKSNEYANMRKYEAHAIQLIRWVQKVQLLSKYETSVRASRWLRRVSVVFAALTVAVDEAKRGCPMDHAPLERAIKCMHEYQVFDKSDFGKKLPIGASRLRAARLYSTLRELEDLADFPGFLFDGNEKADEAIELVLEAMDHSGIRTLDLHEILDAQDFARLWT